MDFPAHPQSDSSKRKEHNLLNNLINPMFGHPHVDHSYVYRLILFQTVL